MRLQDSLVSEYAAAYSGLIAVVNPEAGASASTTGSSQAAADLGYARIPLPFRVLSTTTRRGRVIVDSDRQVMRLERDLLRLPIACMLRPSQNCLN